MYVCMYGSYLYIVPFLEWEVPLSFKCYFGYVQYKMYTSLTENFQFPACHCKYKLVGQIILQRSVCVCVHVCICVHVCVFVCVCV